jgi:hypothetical protein
VIDFLDLPPAVKTLVVVMVWPAIWAGTLIVVALAGDLKRPRQAHATRPIRTEAS